MADTTAENEPASPSGRPSVSIVIPAYNAVGFIGRAVASVQGQTLQDFEIIVVDDRSTDRTVAIVADLASREPRLKLIESECNSGPSASRNRGIAAARGEWIAVLDADDAYRPGRLARLVDFGQTHGLDMIADDLVYYDSTADQIVGRSNANPTGDLLPVDLDSFLQASLFRPALLDFSSQAIVQHALLKFVFRRRFLEDARLRYPEHLRDSEDFYFYAECLLAGARCAIAPAADYLYTQRVGSVSKAPSGRTRTVVDRRQVAAGVDELLRKHGQEFTGTQAELLKRRRSQAIGLRTFEAALSQMRRRQPASALATLTLAPPSWGFLLHALVKRARRNTVQSPG